jgi:galactokinase
MSDATAARAPEVAAKLALRLRGIDWFTWGSADGSSAVPPGAGSGACILTDGTVADRLRDEAVAPAEVGYAHVNCGIMDQMAASLAGQRHMLFIDARSMAYRLLALPPNSELIVIDTGEPCTLAGSKYNQRRAECEEAA